MGTYRQHNQDRPNRLVAILRGTGHRSAWVKGAMVSGLIVAMGAPGAALLVAQGTGHPVAAVRSVVPVLSGATLDAYPAPLLGVTSVTPANAASGVGGTAGVTVSFSSALAGSTPLPSLSPAVAGSWHLIGPSVLRFTPSGGFVPFATETLVVPGGSLGMLSASGVRLAKGVVDHFQVAGGSVLRLQQIMSILDYSPLSWKPAGAPIAPTNLAAQAAAAFTPPGGTFNWRRGGWPTNLINLWHPGSYNAMTKGFVMAFEADHGLSPDGVAGSQVWAAMFRAVAAGMTNSGGYNFAIASEGRPESLDIWHNGVEVFHNAANTGIAQAPTALGTFNVYERLRNQVMRGTNPNGSQYADPVQYVAYFNGGDAVHYIYRPYYGFPQSLGCVELPLGPASVAWSYLSYGTVVQVVS